MPNYRPALSAIDAVVVADLSELRDHLTDVAAT
jgi:hypothetical protein